MTGLLRQYFSTIIDMTVNETFVADRKEITERLMNLNNVNINVKVDEIIFMTAEADINNKLLAISH